MCFDNLQGIFLISDCFKRVFREGFCVKCDFDSFKLSTVIRMFILLDFLRKFLRFYVV
jgi:hypothetical protein